MTLSNFDRWLTTEPSFQPIYVEVQWQEDDVMEDRFPFEDTTCSQCGCVVGGSLGEDPYTGYPNYQFTPFWIVDEDDTVVCDDCMPEEIE